MRDVHRCVTVDYQQLGNGNIANQIHGFTIDYVIYTNKQLDYELKISIAW